MTRFYITPDFECEPCYNGCLVCKNANDCFACQNEYTLSGNQCIPCPINCINCQAVYENTEILTCMTCNLGFYVANATGSPLTSFVQYQ